MQQVGMAKSIKNDMWISSEDKENPDYRLRKELDRRFMLSKEAKKRYERPIIK